MVIDHSSTYQSRHLTLVPAPPRAKDLTAHIGELVRPLQNVVVLKFTEKETTNMKNKTTTTTRRSIPYQQIATLVQANMSAVDIAKKLKRVTKGADPGHSIRAIISRMRTVGYNVNGKTIKLRVKRVGQVKTRKGSK